MDNEIGRVSDEDLLKNLINGYLNSHYQISLEDLDNWYGIKYCNYITELLHERYEFLDLANSSAVTHGTKLINAKDGFNLDNIDFKPGDIVLDIGANIGTLSIYLAKKYPFIKIFAYEPVFTSYKCFIRNIFSNNIPDNIIYVTRKALTLDGRNVSMIVNPHNSKDCQVSETQKEGYIIRAEDRLVESTTLDNIFLENNLGKVKLMRIDCNGDEHEILRNCSPKTLKKIENLVGEFYETPDRPDRNNEDLMKYCKQYIKKLNVISIRK